MNPLDILTALHYKHPTQFGMQTWSGVDASAFVLGFSSTKITATVNKIVVKDGGVKIITLLDASWNLKKSGELMKATLETANAAGESLLSGNVDTGEVFGTLVSQFSRYVLVGAGQPRFDSMGASFLANAAQSKATQHHTR